MKDDAISNLERAHIKVELAICRRWKAVRMGATVQMVRILSTIPPKVLFRIYYSVVLAGDLVVSARADTVGQAVDDINSIIHGYAVQIWARAGAV